MVIMPQSLAPSANPQRAASVPPRPVLPGNTWPAHARPRQTGSVLHVVPAAMGSVSSKLAQTRVIQSALLSSVSAQVCVWLGLP